MMGHDMMSMDTNGDGKISKDEFMAYHEKMWMGMKKDSDGMVDAKTMKMHHDMMMKDKAMMKDKPMTDGFGGPLRRGCSAPRVSRRGAPLHEHGN